MYLLDPAGCSCQHHFGIEISVRVCYGMLFERYTYPVDKLELDWLISGKVVAGLMSPVDDCDVVDEKSLSTFEMVAEIAKELLLLT